MTSEGEAAPGRGYLIAASVVVVIAGMKAAAALVAPVLVAFSFIMVLTPGLLWLEKRGLPRGLALAAIVLAIAVVGASIAFLVGASAAEMAENLPEYQALFAERKAEFLARLAPLGIEAPAASTGPAIDAKAIALAVLERLSTLLGNLFFVLLLILFGLLEANRIPDVLRSDSRHSSASQVDRMRASVRRYMVFKLVAGSVQGVLITLWLWVLGVDNPFLWGFLGGLLNFVPQIGGIVAAALPGVLTLLTDGLPLALAVGLGIGAVTTVVENFLQPKLFNRALGLSMMVTVIAVFFWGWVLGPVVGMFMAVPLTLVLKQSLEANESTRWMAGVLGSVSQPETG